MQNFIEIGVTIPWRKVLQNFFYTLQYFRSLGQISPVWVVGYINPLSRYLQNFVPFCSTFLRYICCQTSSILLTAWSTKKHTVNDVYALNAATTTCQGLLSKSRMADSRTSGLRVSHKSSARTITPPVTTTPHIGPNWNSWFLLRSFFAFSFTTFSFYLVFSVTISSVAQWLFSCEPGWANFSSTWLSSYVCPKINCWDNQLFLSPTEIILFLNEASSGVSWSAVQIICTLPQPWQGYWDSGIPILKVKNSSYLAQKFLLSNNIKGFVYVSIFDL